MAWRVVKALQLSRKCRMECSPLERGEHVGKLKGGDGGGGMEPLGNMEAQAWEVLARASVVSCRTARRELEIAFIAKVKTGWHGEHKEAQRQEAQETKVYT